MKVKYTVPEFEISFNGGAKTWAEALEATVPIMKKIISAMEGGRHTSFRQLEKMIESGDGEGIVALAAAYCESVYKPNASAQARMNNRMNPDGTPIPKRAYKRRGK